MQISRKQPPLVACLILTALAFAAIPIASAQQPNDQQKPKPKPKPDSEAARDETKPGQPDELKPTAKPDAKKPPPLRYVVKVPQRREGKQGVRKSHGRRTPGDDPSSERLLSVLAPDHVGFTLKRQPLVFWFQSFDSKGDLEFALTDLTDRDSPLTVARVIQNEPLSPGIHQIDFAKIRSPSGAPVDLKIEHEYEWTISSLQDSDNPSNNLVTIGRIRRLESTSDAPAGMAFESAQALGHRGIWYDMFQVVETLRHESDRSPKIRDAWIGLLDQIDLGFVPGELGMR